jgi:RHS repeat-associated protein
MFKKFVCLFVSFTFIVSFIPPVPAQTLPAPTLTVSPTTVTAVPGRPQKYVPPTGGGPTDVTGNITTDETWDLSGSPYMIKSNVTVESGSTLTILPGVVVKFDGYFGLDIEGALHAVGNLLNKITFTSNQPSPAPGNWQHLRLNSSSTLKHAVVEYSDIGVGPGGAIVSHTTLRKNNIGLKLTTPTTQPIAHNKIKDNAVGILIEGGIAGSYFQGTISNNAIENNSSFNLVLNGAAAPGVTINAPNNWWGTTDPASIEASIFDNLDNATLPVVDYTPFLDGPNGNPVDPNKPPVLNPIGDQSVDVGTTLSLTLTATDPNAADNLIFSALPLPLPEGMSLNAQTGIFKFKPNEEQVGDTVFTFKVSDGVLSDTETVTITVNPIMPGGMTKIIGRVLDSTEAALGNTVAIVNSRISLLSAPGNFVLTDANGNFTLNNAATGKQVLDVDNTNAGSTIPGAKYSSFREEIEVINGVDNIIENPIYLPQIDTSSETPVDPNATTMVYNPNLNITLEVAAHNAKVGCPSNCQDFTGMLSISEVPDGFEPAPLPPFLEPGLLITLQPVGVSYITPAPITFENTENFAVGTQVNLWSLDAGTGQFVVVGILEAKPNGMLETTSGGIKNNDWHMAMPPVTDPIPSGPNPNNQDTKKCQEMCYLSQVAVSSGELIEEHVFPSYRSLGQNRALRFVYRSLQADPQPIVSTNITIPVISAVPQSISAGLTVAGIDQGVKVFTSTAGLSENQNETIRQVVQFDAADFPTGRYPYQMKITNNYSLSKVSGTFQGDVLINNQMNSPFGAGWGIDGLSRLHISEDNRVVLTQGDGAIKFFNPSESGTALRLDGVNDYAIIGPGGALSNATFEAWIQSPLSRTDVGVIVDQQDGPNPSCTYGYVLSTVGKEACFDVNPSQCGTGHAVCSNIEELAGEWIHLAGVHDNTNDMQYLYVNGELAASDTVNINIPTTYVVLGALKFFNGTQAHFLGDMDDVRIWNTARTQSQIQSTMNSVLTGTEPGLVSYWKLNEGSRQTINDSGPQPNPGVLGNSPNPGSDDPLWTASGAGINCTSTICNYISPDGDFSQLVKNRDGSFTRTMENGMVHQFDAAGFHILTIDRNGNTTNYTYTPDGKLETITDPMNQVTTLVYGTDGFLETVTDPAGRVTQFIHDPNGNLIKIIDPDLTEREFTYDSRHRMTNKTNKRDFTTTYQYSFAGRSIQANWPDGSTRKIAPSEIVGLPDIASGVGTETNPAPFVRPEDAVSTFTDGNDNDTVFTTDSFGAATLVVDALNQTTTTARNSDGLPISITTPKGNGSKFVYDSANLDGKSQGNLLETRQKANMALADNDTNDIVTKYTYEPQFNQVKTIKDPKGNDTTINYDVSGNPIEIIDDNNVATKLEYADASCPGVVTKITNAFGLPEQSITTFEYDPADCNLKNVIDPLLRQTTLTYDPAGNAKTVTDGEGKLTAFDYDELNRLEKVTDADLEETVYDYDEEGNLTQVTDAKNNLTKFNYDEVNRLEKVTDPLNKFETYIYDANGNLQTLIDRKNQVLAFVYDVLHRLDQKILPSNLVTDFGYDPVSNLTTVTDPDSALTFLYDGFDRLQQAKTDGSPVQPAVTIDYTYDKNDNRDLMTDNLGGSVDYTFDNLNRLDTIVKSALTFNFDYDALSRRKKATLPNGTVTDYAYDVASQLTSLTHSLVSVPFTQFDYTQYDGVGNKEVVSVQRSGVSVQSPLNYVYDDLYRLDTATKVLPMGVGEDYAYDAVGNRLTKAGQIAPSVFDAANRLLEDADYTYQYDDNGNLISKTQVATSQVTSYSYDAENQLISLQSPGVSAQYKYDGLGRRIEKAINSSPFTRYIYDNEDILLEYNGSNALQARYTHGVGIDEPLMMERDLNANLTFEPSERFFYHTDGLGSITDLTSSTGTIAQSYLYDSFGQIITVTSGLENPYTYTGRELDDESGLYFYRARYYDPAIGRFINEDPFPGYLELIS